MFRIPIFRRPTITRQMLLWFLGAALAPLLVTTFALDAISDRAVRHEALDHLDSLAASKASQMETYAVERRGDALALARNPTVAAAIKRLSALFGRHGAESPEYVATEQELRDYLKVYPDVYGYADVFLVSESGDELFALHQHGEQGTNYETGPYRDTELARSFDQARTTRALAITRFAPFARCGDSATFIAVPVLDGETFLGVVVLQVGSAQIYQMVNNYSGLGKTGEIVVVSLAGDTITFVAPTRHAPQAAFRKTLSAADPMAHRLLKAARGIEGQGIGVDYRKVQTVAAWRYLPSWRWGMVVKMDSDEVFDVITRLRRLGILLVVFTLALVFGVAYKAATSISRPIVRLTTAARRMAEGELGTQVAIQRADEIGELAQAFNKMAADLKAMYSTIEAQVRERTRELRDQEQRFRQLAENIREVFWLAAPDFREIIYVSPAFERVWGRSLASLYSAPETWRDAMHPDDRDRVNETWRLAVAAQRDFESEYRLLLADGAVRWIFDRGFPVRDSSGKMYRMAGIAEDITDRKAAEEALRRSSVYNRSLIETSLDPLVTIGADGKIMDVNAATEAVTGCSRRELIGTDFADYFTAPAHARAGYEQAFREGEVRDYPLEIRRKDGHLTPVLYNASLYRDESGKVLGLFAAARDVTERKRAEEAMRRAKEAAEEADRVKSDFLMNISHEIRSPMNGILGLTGLALDTRLTDEQRGYLEGAMLSAESLLQMINAILDFSRLDEQGLELEQAPFRLREALANTIQTLESRAREKGLAMLYEIRPDVPDELAGDPARLWQVIVNLVGNAIKFTREGRVSLLVETEEVTPESATLRFTISDTGGGIPADKQEAVFMPFVQADSSKTRKFGGAGLGLAVSARLVELMGGRIWFESEPGQGSTFHFTARFGRTETVGAPTRSSSLAPSENPTSGNALAATRGVDPAAAPPPGPWRVLVVEDNLINQKLIVRILQKAGHTVAVANDGKEALAALAREDFDVVLMDVQMPVMDGFEATAEIRKQEAGIGRRLPVVALTAHAMQGDRERCLQAGMDGYVAKPIQRNDLFDSIAAAVAACACRGAANGNPQTGELAGLNQKTL